MSNYESIFDNDSVRVKLADTEDGIALSLDFMEGDESTAGTTLYIGQEQIDGMCAWLEKYRSRPEVSRSDPGTGKILWNLLDRAYKMMLMAIGPVHEQDSDSNDPIVAWASDVRKVLYGSGRVPSLADIQSLPPEALRGGDGMSAGRFHCACIFSRPTDFSEAVLVSECAFHSARSGGPVGIERMQAELACQWSRCVSHDMSKPRCDHCPIEALASIPSPLAEKR